MTVYRFDKHSHLARRKVVKLGVLSLAIVGILFLAVYFLLFRSSVVQQPVENTPSEISYSPFKEFSTNYFRFSAPESWQEAGDLGDSVDTFVYRKYLNLTPIGLLTVKVNIPNPTLNTSIVPVVVNDGRITQIGEPSEHCSNFLPPGANSDPRNVTVQDVTFRCWTDGTNFIVSAGSRGGGLQLPLKRLNGSVVLYSITFQNTAFKEDKNSILEVLRTFEAR